MSLQRTSEEKLLIVTNFLPQNPFVEALVQTIPIRADFCYLDITGRRAGNLLIRHIMTLWLAGVVLSKSRYYKHMIICEQFIGLYYCFLSRVFLFIKRCPEVLLISLMYNPRRGWLGHIYKLFYQFCLDSKAIQYFICHSSTEREMYLKEFGPDKKDSIIFLKLGGGKPFNTKSDPQRGTDRYFFSGGSSNRDYRTLVQAFDGLEERLIIACYPSDVKGLRIPANVEIRHNVYAEDFTRLMERSYAVILPLLKTEVSSGQLVLLDAMRVGKAIVVTKGGCTRDYLPPDVGIIVEPCLVEEIRTAVQHLVRDPERTRRLGRKAKACYEQDHTAMRYAQRLATFLNGDGGFRGVAAQDRRPMEKVIIHGE